MGVELTYRIPTQEEWETMHECLDAYIDFLRKEQPNAFHTISMLEELSLTLPIEVEEAFDYEEKIAKRA